MIITPRGEALEAKKHGLSAILKALLDVANILKNVTEQKSIMHRDVKPSNIILYNDQGYLIDWGSADVNVTNTLNATALFCSFRVYSFSLRINCISCHQDANSKPFCLPGFGIS
jgi:serine/threonine protein kinase